MRSIQDWFLEYEIQTVPGVAMLVYLNQAHEEYLKSSRKAGELMTLTDLKGTLKEGALLRVQPN